MIRKLFFVVGTQSNFRAALGTAIQCGKEYGFEVWIIDLNALNSNGHRFPNEWCKHGIEGRVLAANSLDQLKQTCAPHVGKNAVVLFLNPPGGHLAKAWRILERKCPNIGMLTISPVPSIRNRHSNKLLSNLRAVASWFKSLTKPVPSIWVVSGSQCIAHYRSYFRHTKKTHFIYGHSLEYEQLQHTRYGLEGSNPIDLASFILVMDQGWFSKQKPGYISNHQYPPAPRNKLSKEMHHFLRELESRTDLKVVVSCHPKADLEDTREFYTGFPVVDTRTFELVRHCKLAVANTSTSIQYAVIANKPLILITTDELSTSIMHPMEKAIGNELGLAYINISRDCANALQAALASDNTAHYQNFSQRFIRQKKAPDLPLWQAVFDGLKKAPS